jgi:hypothetical protein
MGRLVKVGLGVAAVVLVGGQAIRPERSNPPVERDVGAPPEVAALLRRACYDCHSHETVWPWYSLVAPVSWLVAHDVSEGREELNFSTWAAYGPRKKAKKLDELAEMVTDGEMPPWIYCLAHPPARLTPDEQRVLTAWSDAELTGLGR